MAERAPFVREQPQSVPVLPDYTAFMANSKFGKTKADRQGAYDKLVTDRNGIIESNKGLPERNAKAFQTWKDEGAALNSDAQAGYDATTRGQIMNAAKQFGPYIAGAGAGFGISSAADAGERAMIDRTAANLKSAASAANTLNWRDPSVQNQLAGAVQTGEKYLPSKHPILNSIGIKSLSYGVPAAAALYEMSRYSDSAKDPNRSEAQREQDRMYANALMAAAGEMGFHGGVKLAIPYSADTGASEATIRGARGALTDMAKRTEPADEAVQKALEAANKVPPSFKKGDTPTDAMRELARYLDVPAQQGAVMKSWSPAVAKAAANASDAQIADIAKNARPAIEGASRADVLAWINKLSKAGARRLPVVAGAAYLGASGLGGGDEAEAAGYDPTSEMHGGPSIPPRSGFGERLQNALRAAGKDAALGAYESQIGPSDFGPTEEQAKAAQAAEDRYKAQAAKITALPHPMQSNPEELRQSQSNRRSLERMQAQDARDVAAAKMQSQLGREFDTKSGRYAPAMPDAEFNQHRPELQSLADRVANDRGAMQTLYNAADDDAKLAGGFAKGGAVHPHMATLSHVQMSLEADLKKHAKTIEKAEKAKGNSAHKHLSKAQAAQAAAVDDVWHVHHLAKKVNAGKVHLKPGMTKDAIIKLARAHATS